MSDDIVLNKEDPFESVMAEVIKTHRERNAMYRTSPLEILPIEDWLAQVAIKGVRAQQALTSAKTKDELKDNIVYSGLVIVQIDSQQWVPKE